MPSTEFEALGTHWFIGPLLSSDMIAGILLRLDAIDKVWSRFSDTSMVAAMSQKAGLYTLSSGDRGLMEWYKALYDATAGKVTPLIGQTISDAGYDKTYSLKPKSKITQTPDWDSVIGLDGNTLIIKQPWLLDVGAAGKGYAVDEVFELLGADNLLVDGSGDIRVGNEQAQIGLEDPFDSSKIIGVADIKNASICGSAINRRKWGEWSHVIDPTTSRSVDGIVATWVVSDSAMHADGLSTALFFVKPGSLSHLGPFEYCIVHLDGSIEASSGGMITIFTEIEK